MTLEDTLKSIASLSPQEKRALLAKLLQERKGRVKTAPLSYAQQQIWFLDQLEPNNVVYNLPMVLRLRGPLNVEALRKSIENVVQRHEILRTIFSSLEGVPQQIVTKSTPSSFSLLDLSTWEEPAREMKLRAVLAEDAEKPFHLATGPLIRMGLVRLGPDDHVLWMTFHHIIMDGWSSGILLTELGAGYESALSGTTPALADLPIQYADYARWQRQWLEGPDLTDLLAFWKNRLAGISRLEFPTDWPRPSIQSFKGDRHREPLPGHLYQRLKDFSRQHRATLFMSLLAVFKTLLHRYTGQDEIVVGTPVAGRNRTEVETLIGLFINSLVLRTGLSGDLTFLELLQRVRETTVEAFSHQEIPFERLVEELQPERSASQHPLFQVLFNLVPTPVLNMQMKGLKVTPLEAENHTAKVDLTLEIYELPGELQCEFECNSDLFKVATVRRLMKHYFTLMEAALEAPDRPIRELPLLRDSEREQLLVDWSGRRNQPGPEECAHQKFESQVERTPDAIAVVDSSSSLTYTQLNRRANQLARHLRELGVGRDVPVGLWVERSVEMLVGMLGVLKAGGAYVPMDPTYPVGRLQYMLEDSATPVLLTQEGLTRQVSLPVRQVICLDRDWPTIGRQSETNLEKDVSPADLAYMIYTSGSTGQPKGVMIEHRSLSRFADAALESYSIAASDRVLQFASISFDTAAEEIFPTLAIGATLVLRSEAMLGPAAVFLRACAEKGITVLDLPTAYWHQITASMVEDHLRPPEGLRTVIIGGERALPQIVSLWQRHIAPLHPQVRLINTYGPTEATVVATVCDLVPGEPGHMTEVPIGRPIRGARTYVLDQDRQPVPIGVKGELCLGGTGLARGYLHRPEMTAQKFVPDPFSEDPGARLYLTGDLVRWLDNGQLDYVGRRDEQVKIRGFRIELGEIEAVLRQHAAVKEAAVTAREETAGDPSTVRLVAYIVPHNALEVAEDGLRAFLKTKLPDYMLPALYVSLERLPLLPNGKVDRLALPTPVGGVPSSQETFISPTSPVEKILAEIWAAMLGRKTIGARDNFFDLGGHSLMATQVISRITKILNVEVPLVALFEAPTLAEFALVIEEHLIGDIEKLSEEEAKGLLAAGSHQEAG